MYYNDTNNVSESRLEAGVKAVKRNFKRNKAFWLWCEFDFYHIPGIWIEIFCNHKQ